MSKSVSDENELKTRVTRASARRIGSVEREISAPSTPLKNVLNPIKENETSKTSRESTASPRGRNRIKPTTKSNEDSDASVTPEAVKSTRTTSKQNNDLGSTEIPTSARRNTRRTSIEPLTPSLVLTPTRRSTRRISLNSEDSNQSAALSQPMTISLNRTKVPSPLPEEDETETGPSSTVPSPAVSSTSVRRISTRASSKSPNVSDQSLNSATDNKNDSTPISKSPKKNWNSAMANAESSTPINSKTNKANPMKNSSDNKTPMVSTLDYYIDLVTPLKVTAASQNDASTVLLNDTTLEATEINQADTTEVKDETINSPKKRQSISDNVVDSPKFKTPGQNTSNTQNTPKSNTPKSVEKESPQKTLIVKEVTPRRSWSQPVHSRSLEKGATEKIDRFVPNASPASDKKQHKFVLSARDIIKNIKSIEDSDSDDDDEDEDEESREKSLFIDDEAFEAAEGDTDSMSSSERRYIEDHEVPVKGVELGSDDTAESNDDDDDSGSNMSFIVEDEDDDDDASIPFIDESIVIKKQNVKKRSRIIENIDSSDEEPEGPVTSETAVSIETDKEEEFHGNSSLKHFTGTLSNSLESDPEEQNLNQTVTVEDALEIIPPSNDEATPRKEGLLNVSKSSTKSQSAKNTPVKENASKVVDHTPQKVTLKETNKSPARNTPGNKSVANISHVEVSSNVATPPRSRRLSEMQQAHANESILPPSSPSKSTHNANNGLQTPEPMEIDESLCLPNDSVLSAKATPKSKRNSAVMNLNESYKSVGSGTTFSQNSVEDKAPSSDEEESSTKTPIVENLLRAEKNSLASPAKKRKSVSENSETSAAVVSTKNEPKISTATIQQRIHEIMQKKEEEKKLLRQQMPKKDKKKKKSKLLSESPIKSQVDDEEEDPLANEQPEPNHDSSISEAEETSPTHNIKASKSLSPTKKQTEIKRANKSLNITPMFSFASDDSNSDNAEDVAEQSPAVEDEDESPIVDKNTSARKGSTTPNIKFGFDDESDNDDTNPLLQFIHSEFLSKKSPKSKTVDETIANEDEDDSSSSINEETIIPNLAKRKSQTIRAKSVSTPKRSENVKVHKLNKSVNDESLLKLVNKSRASLSKANELNVSLTTSGAFVEEEIGGSDNDAQNDDSYVTIESEPSENNNKIHIKKQTKSKGVDRSLEKKFTKKEKLLIKQLDEDLQVVNAQLELGVQLLRQKKFEKKLKKLKKHDDQVPTQPQEPQEEEAAAAPEKKQKTKPKKKVLGILNKVNKNIVVEPVTPVAPSLSGFKESPITPKHMYGFKMSPMTPIVRDKLSAKQRIAERKRKLDNIQEPSDIPPGAIWSASGAFVVAKKPKLERIIPTASATEFKVAVLSNANKKSKVPPKPEASTSTAANFKHDMLYKRQGTARVSAKELYNQYKSKKLNNKVNF